MKRTTIFIDEAMEKELQLLARRRKTPAASLVREAIAAYVTSAATAPALSFVGVGASGCSDTAERHEELLWSGDESAASPAATSRPKRSSRKRR
jgi:hypothetical protein